MFLGERISRWIENVFLEWFGQLGSLEHRMHVRFSEWTAGALCVSAVGLVFRAY